MLKTIITLKPQIISLELNSMKMLNKRYRYLYVYKYTISIHFDVTIGKLVPTYRLYCNTVNKKSF